MDINDFNEIYAGDVFASGEIENSPDGIYMTDFRKGSMLRWIAKKGFGNDWTIYCGWSENSWEWIERSGDKITSPQNIQKLVPCDEEVMNKYRK